MITFSTVAFGSIDSYVCIWIGKWPLNGEVSWLHTFRVANLNMTLIQHDTDQKRLG